MLRPLGAVIFIKRDDAVSRSDGGIYFPEYAQEKSKTGTVVSVGEGFYTETGVFVPMNLKPGDRVLFSPHVGQAIEHDGEKLWQMKCGDVIAVIEE